MRTELPASPQFSLMSNEEQISLNKMRYGWSKYGGANYGIAKQTGTAGDLSRDLDDNIWYCQLCGAEQTNDLPNYLFSLDDAQRDFIRVCSKCKFEAIGKKAKSYRELMKLPPEETKVVKQTPVEPDTLLNTFVKIDNAFDRLDVKDYSQHESVYERKTIDEYLVCVQFLEQIADEKITQNVADLASQLLSRLTLID